MEKFARIIEKAIDLDPNKIGVAEVQLSGWNSSYPYLVAIRFPQRYHANPNYDTHTTLVAGLNLETAEEIASVVNSR